GAGGRRNVSRFLVQTGKRLAGDGIRKALGCILSPYRTEASWDRYQKNIAAARAKLRDNVPEVDYCAVWHDHPFFIQAWVELIQASLAEIPSYRQQTTPLVFTAHSIPVAMADRSPYVEQVQITSRLIAERLGSSRSSLPSHSRRCKPP